VLQEQWLQRLGGGKTNRVNVRLVAATHRNLEPMVKQKEFRSDLYYPLDVFPIALPPLRARPQDIALLVSHFLAIFSRRMGKQISSIPNETLDAFTSYSWPGNMRSDNGMLANALTTSHPNLLEPHVINANAVVLTFARQSTFWDSQ
jgi:formate hydrogenlyase transcriptional activator